MPTELDFSFKVEVSEKIGSIDFQSCVFCGMCTAGCSYAGLRPDLDPRKFMRQIALGMRDDVLGSAFMWLCTICERCTINCPMDVNIAEVVQSIRGKFGIRPPGDLMLQCRATGGSKSLLKNMAGWLEKGLIKVDPGRNPDPVTYHDPCNLGRKEGVVDEPRYILSRVCADFREMTPGGRYNYCCGSSGGALFSSEYDDLRLAMGRLKAEQIEKTGAAVVATACLNCYEQLEKISNKYGLGVQVKFVHELVDQAIVPSGLKSS
ncbi:(Fe-S)-binding protein [Desulfotomaculum copahuensis]|uniref:4Fe-4S ferredoxin-type domain-containing protein n=1 Tax=Desulfotomaculum copahuensis TaxID=1838280 RepID=A0A1B7LDT8_9FIRM|nr:heterodisulfide reductase-related iron-sulfur binding cluster [Desulfotomaculum copahuensis]OAT81262.1 hypothetical protein A6M21_00240 [Desulfotomaculum copahuensis]